MKLPVSAMVVGYNEGYLLDNCLSSLFFCDEIIYTDLGSIDNSISIAQKYCSQVYSRNIVPSGEYIQAEIVRLVKNDWVVFLDPDEVVDLSLVSLLKENFKTISDSNVIGAVIVPWLFYFNGRPLKGTIWGGMNTKYFLVNRNRFEFSPVTHYGRKLIEGFESLRVPPNTSSTNVLHHYWMKDYRMFFKKHFRYLKKEGKDQYELGVRFRGVQYTLLIPFREFINSYVKCAGYKDGLIGLFLSLFWAFYQSYIAVDILMIQFKKRL